MFLHSGASLHGHEFSSKSPHHHPPTQTRIRIRPPFGAHNGPRHTDQAGTALRSRSFEVPSPSPRPTQARPRPISDISPHREHIVRFDEEPTILSSVATSEDESTFSDGGGLAHSDDRATGKKRRRTRRTPKQATNFLLAHPPSKLRGKQRRFSQTRSRLLLQLQQLSAERRPKPTVDVLSSSAFAGSHAFPRLIRHFPLVFKSKANLGRDDLVLAKSEDYDSHYENWNSRDLDKRELLAVISPVAAGSKVDAQAGLRDAAEIVLGDGSVWTANTFRNGYEFRHMDRHGTVKTARWVKQKTKANIQTQAAADDGAKDAISGGSRWPLANPDYKFTFSMIDPSSRRHPILATLTPSNLEVLDSYTTVSKSSGRHPPTKPFRPELSGTGLGTQPPEPTPERSSYPIDEATRILITVTSVWVSLRYGQNWPSLDPAVAFRSGIPAPCTGSIGSNGGADRVRASTFPLSTGTAHPSEWGGNPSPAATTPRRAVSTGAAFMQRRQARLRDRESAESGAHTANDSDGAADDLKPRLEASEQKPADSRGKRRGFCVKIRDWGHKITPHSSKGSAPAAGERHI